MELETLRKEFLGHVGLRTDDKSILPSERYLRIISNMEQNFEEKHQRSKFLVKNITLKIGTKTTEFLENRLKFQDFDHRIYFRQLEWVGEPISYEIGKIKIERNESSDVNIELADVLCGTIIWRFVRVREIGSEYSRDSTS